MRDPESMIRRFPGPVVIRLVRVWALMAKMMVRRMVHGRHWGWKAVQRLCPMMRLCPMRHLCPMMRMGSGMQRGRNREGEREQQSERNVEEPHPIRVGRFGTGSKARPGGATGALIPDRA